MEKVNEVRVEVSATDAARIAAGSAQYDMERAALLGCHNQECAGVVTTIPLEAGKLAVCVTRPTPRCEVMDSGAERLAVGIKSTAKHFGAKPSTKK